jgi:NADH-quinone oxidoreductase subunit L
MAATIGLVQNDIKRVLAYSTVSQLGYMFLACGVGAFGAGIFHLMTHAFFKALLFLGSGSVIHAMAGEQDMQRMGGLKRYMPVTFVTMMIGTLAIAGIPPLAGFFSKDEILYQAFLHNRALWGLAALTALLTAFYMARLMVLTFYGAYRGPAWSRHASPAAIAEAAAHGARHPRDSHAHGEAERDDHEVTHGAADVIAPAAAGQGLWHGPHEAPRRMTGPLVLLAIGASVTGFLGIPAALGGAHALDRFLEPSFAGAVPLATGTADEHVSHLGELALMLLSIGLAATGIAAARHVYLTRPGLAARLAARWPGIHSLLFHKYYVDELYRATVVSSGFAAARGLWIFDARVVDGAVNGSGWLTKLASWFSHMTDKYVVDGLVNLVGWTAGEGSYALRRIQTGLVQNYALLMLIGVFALVTLYLLVR